MGKEILELLGNKFEVLPKCKFWFEVPQEKFKRLIYTRDRISNIDFLLGETNKGKWYYIKYNAGYDMYYVYPLKFIEYDESKDMRYEWKYRKRR